jgi:methionyl-tRNA synthetase
MEDILNQGGIFLFGMFVLIIWSFVWKGLALWQAARNGHKGWFVALLLINTVGILEILYIYVFGKTPKQS